jgi:hypothetical protein
MLKDVLIAFYTGEDAKNQLAIYRELNEIRDKSDNIAYIGDNLEQLLDFERYVIFNKGINRFIVEEMVLEFFHSLIIRIGNNYDFDFNITMLDKLLVMKSENRELKQVHTINLTFLNFAKELFAISIPRDSFSSKRKGLALGIISRLSKFYDIPDKFELFMVALKSTKDKLIIEALNELHYYYRNRPDEDLQEAIVIELDKIVLKTKSRTVATGALNLQVITGYIGDFEALSRIDDWKEKNYDNLWG